MPTFDFTSPDGKSYSVDGPDGATSDQAFQILQQHLGTPDPEGSSSATGIAKSLGVGLGEGAIGLAGLPADLANIFGNARDKYLVNPIARKLGIQELPVDKPTPLDKFGGEAIRSGVKSITGDFYKPQGTTEEIAKAAGEWLPSIIGGPETLAAKLATRVAAPVLASETAGALTNDNPYAKAGAGLVGALAGPAAFNRAVRVMRPANVEPTVAELKAASRAGYRDPEVEAIRIAPQATERLADTIRNDLQFGPGSGFRPTNGAHAPVFQEVENLRAPAPQGATAGPMPKTVADVDNVRQALNTIAKERDITGSYTPAAAAAQRAMRHIDNFLPNLQQGELLAGDANRANAILRQSQANWGAAKRAQYAQRLASDAEIDAASANSGGNIQNATKQQFKKLLKNNAAKAVGYSDDEIAALNQIVRGTWTGSAARAAGNLLGGGGGLGMLVGGAAGYHEGGLPGAIAVGLAGRGLKMIGNRSTLNAVGRLDRMLRNRSPFAVQVAAQNPQIAMQLPPAAVRRLQVAIAANPVLAAQVGQPVQGNSRQER